MLTRLRTVGICPRQLFTKAHPQRPAPLVAKATAAIFSPDLPIESQAPALIECILPIFELPSQISHIYPSPGAPDKTTAVTTQALLLPGDPSHIVSWGWADQSVRLHARGSNIPVTLFENMHSEFVSAACWADERTFVTGSTE